MTNSIKSRLLVIGLLLSVAVGAPVASILGNAPHRAAATASASEVAEPTVYEMPMDTVRPTLTLPVTDVVGRAPRKAVTARAKKDAGEEKVWRCETRRLDSDYAASVRICGEG